MCPGAYVLRDPSDLGMSCAKCALAFATAGPPSGNNLSIPTFDSPVQRW